FREKKIGKEKELAKFLDEAANASSVKWRAARVRMEYLLTPIKTEKIPEQKPGGIGAAIPEENKSKSDKGETKHDSQEVEEKADDSDKHDATYKTASKSSSATSAEGEGTVS